MSEFFLLRVATAPIHRRLARQLDENDIKTKVSQKFRIRTRECYEVDRCMQRFKLLFNKRHRIESEIFDLVAIRLTSRIIRAEYGILRSQS